MHGLPELFCLSIWVDFLSRFSVLADEIIFPSMTSNAPTSFAEKQPQIMMYFEYGALQIISAVLLLSPDITSSITAEDFYICFI